MLQLMTETKLDDRVFCSEYIVMFMDASNDFLHIKKRNEIKIETVMRGNESLMM